MRPSRLISSPAGWAVLTFISGLACPPRADAHAGAFILAKCRTGPENQVILTLSVDCGQHPVLTSPDLAREAMRHVLQLEPAAPGDPVRPLSALAVEKQITGSTPDPEIPLPPEPGDETRVHQLEMLEYSWRTDQADLNFSIPDKNPHDVLFWLSGDARPADGPVPWRILIAGDRTPPVPMGPGGSARIAASPILSQAPEKTSAVPSFPVASSVPDKSTKWLLAGSALGLPILCVWILRRKASHR